MEIKIGNAKGPKGATGATGPAGPTGATGPRGEPGPALVSKAVTVVLTAAGWTGTAAPYTQTVTVSGMTAATNGQIGLAQSATAAARTAARAALLCVTGQASGSLTITADGKYPAVDIPVTVMLF